MYVKPLVESSGANVDSQLSGITLSEQRETSFLGLLKENALSVSLDVEQHCFKRLKSRNNN